MQKAVLVHDGKLLMLRRSESDVRRPLEWDLPGGIREPNEGLIESLKREVREECGLESKDLTPVYTKTELREWIDKQTNQKHIMNVVYIFYIGHTDSEDVNLSEEHIEFQWEELEMALPQFKYNLHKELLGYIAEKQLLK